MSETREQDGPEQNNLNLRVKAELVSTGTCRYNGQCLVSGPDLYNKSWTITDASDPTVTGSVCRLFFANLTS